MPFHVEVTTEIVELRITGALDRLLSLSSGVRIARSEVVDARAATWDEARAEMGWRVGGSYVPGLLATGWYTVKGRKGARQLWAVKRDRSSLLVIDTSLDRPARVVVAVPDAAALARQITGGTGAR